MNLHDYLAPGNILWLVTHMLTQINNNQNIKGLPGQRGKESQEGLNLAYMWKTTKVWRLKKGLSYRDS